MTPPTPGSSPIEPDPEVGAQQSDTILQAAMDGFWRVDLQGRVLETNPAYCRMSGYSAEELRSSTIDKFVFKSLEQLQASFAMLKTIGAMRFESRHRRKDGSLFDAEVSAKYMTLRGEDQIVAFVRDVTEQKRVVNALRDSEKRLRRAVVAGNVGLWEWDLGSDQVYYSPEWKRQLGYEEHEISGSFAEWQGRVHPDDVAGAIAKLQAYMSDPVGLHEVEVRLRHKDGSYRWILAQASIDSGAAGTPRTMLGSHIDITERKQLEEHRRQSETMTAIGQLAGGIAHDFNNQLAVIVGRSELLLYDHDSPPVRKTVGIILNTAQRAAKLTHQLLAYARRAAHRAERIALPALLGELAELLYRSIDLRIRVDLRLAAMRDIDGDPGLFQNALLNLALNACAAMPDGGTLTFATADRDLDAAGIKRLGLSGPAAAWVEIEVRDTGIGMSPEVMARIFEPFYTTKNAGKGTGLGLAAVQGTIQQMGGSIAVESRPGQGSTFRLLLPSGHLPPAVAQPSSAPGRRLRLLVVDDDDDVRGALCDQLDRRGHHVVGLGDGPSAIRWFSEHAAQTDLVLLDLNMPQLSGQEVLTATRAIGPAVPVVIVTGNAAQAMSQGALDLGARAILQKPVSAADLDHLGNFAEPPVSPSP